MRNLYVNQLASDWVEDSTTEITRISVEKKIDSFGKGDLEYATEILSALWEIANKDGDIKAPSSTPAIAKAPPSGPPIVSRPGSVYSQRFTGVLTLCIQFPPVPTHWASVKIALIKSIRNGVLFDRKYWARHSKTGDVFKPVYFSSIVMGDKAQELTSRTSRASYDLPRG